MSKNKNRIFYQQKFFALDQQIYSSLVWTGRKKRLPSYKLAALNLRIILRPHSMCETKDIPLKSWSGCKWKKISLDLLPQVVEEWEHMTPL